MLGKGEPLATIIMPVFNCEKYVGKAIESIVRQTYEQWQLIIVDDGSTDDSFSIACRWEREIGRDRIIAWSVPHKGEVVARNLALKYVNTEYVMNHDADDVSMPNKLLQLAKHLDANPSIAAVGSDAYLIDDKDTILTPLAMEYSPKRIRATFEFQNPMIHSSVLMRTKIVKALEGYRENFSPADDFDLWARMLLHHFEIENLPEKLHMVRQHSESITATRKEEMMEKFNQISAYYRILDGL